MNQPTRLLFFAGSARATSVNKKLARCGAAIAAAHGYDATFLDLADYPMPLYDGDGEASDGVPVAARALKDQLAAHAGVFIAAPEYNASITPLLKNALDWVTRVRSDDESPKAVFQSRVFLLGGASPGGGGGLRGLFSVRHVLVQGLGALVLPDQMLLPRAGDAFDDAGALIDQTTADRFAAQIVQLATTAAALGKVDA